MSRESSPYSQAGKRRVIRLSGEGVLDLQGMGGFIPYALVEELVKKTGKVTVAADLETVRLLRVWAERRGYLVEYTGSDRLTIRRPAAAVAAAREAKPAEARVPQVLLEVDSASWDNAMSQKLAEARFIINVVLSAPIVYRGPANTPEFRSAILGEGPLLLRVQLGGVDYFLLVKAGRVVAGAQLGVPINPSQTENIVKTIVEDENVLVTVYDVSQLQPFNNMK